MKHLKKYLESNNTDQVQMRINELKLLISELPDMRWNISEDSGYWGDEWDNWEHMDEEERQEYFCKIWSVVKKLKDKIEQL